MDMDYEFRLNMNELRLKYDFFAGMEAPKIGVKRIIPSISIVGSAPNYKLLKLTIPYIKEKMEACYPKNIDSCIISDLK